MPDPRFPGLDFDLPEVETPREFRPTVQARRELPRNPDWRTLPARPKTFPIHDPEGTFTGKYDPAVIHDVISKSKSNKIDPMTGLAMALQESNIGTSDFAGRVNPMSLNPSSKDTTSPVRGLDWQNLPPEALRPFYLQASFDRLKENRRLVPSNSDEDLKIQTYNGLGRIHGGSVVDPKTPMYGGQFNLHGRRDRPYGKQVIKLRENVIEPNSAIQALTKLYD